jgi:oxygen-dependent protoporphyrinogen oxidase
VLEATDRLGGKLSTEEVGGLAVDTGAESFLVTRPEARALARDLGLADEIEPQAASAASLWIGDRLRPIPAGQVMGIPTDLHALAASDLISLPGLARIPLDRFLPPIDLAEDVAVGDLVRRRIGGEVVDRLVEPLLGGVYAGHAGQLSLAATMPGLASAVRRRGSLLAAASDAAARPRLPGPAFATIRGGMGRLIEALARGSGAGIRRDAPVAGLRRTRSGWQLEVVGEDPGVVAADGVIVATPASEMAALLRGVAPYAAAQVGAVPYAQVAVITYRLPDGADRLPAGSGFLVPPTEGRLVKASTFSSQKWRSIGEAAGTGVLLRCSIGRFGEEETLQRDDDELAGAAWAELREATGLGGQPVDSRVTRWSPALPQYLVGHTERAALIRQALRGMPGLALAGAALDGVGVPAVIASAEAAAATSLAGIGVGQRSGMIGA